MCQQTPASAHLQRMLAKLFYLPVFLSETRRRPLRLSDLVSQREKIT